jgi:hypothetical protein
MRRIESFAGGCAACTFIGKRKLNASASSDKYTKLVFENIAFSWLLQHFITRWLEGKERKAPPGITPLRW